MIFNYFWSKFISLAFWNLCITSEIDQLVVMYGDTFYINKEL